MSVPFWVAELAGAFWTQARCDEPFPRTLRKPIRALRLTSPLIPQLTVASARAWLERCGIVCDLPGRNRGLHGCLVARHGHGFALIDAEQSNDEQRFSLAHETAHFLKDYWSLRNEVQRRLGDSALEVMDGLRPPTPAERLHALLRCVPLGFYVHLMERNAEGAVTSSATAAVEENADRLAYELLAPAEHVLASGAAANARELAERLCCFYGLPEMQALRYSQILAPRRWTDPTILRLRGLADL